MRTNRKLGRIINEPNVTGLVGGALTGGGLFVGCPSLLSSSAGGVLVGFGAFAAGVVLAGYGSWFAREQGQRVGATALSTAAGLLGSTAVGALFSDAPWFLDANIALIPGVFAAHELKRAWDSQRAPQAA